MYTLACWTRDNNAKIQNLHLEQNGIDSNDFNIKFRTLKNCFHGMNIIFDDSNAQSSNTWGKTQDTEATPNGWGASESITNDWGASESTTNDWGASEANTSGWGTNETNSNDWGTGESNANDWGAPTTSNENSWGTPDPPASNNSSAAWPAEGSILSFENPYQFKPTNFIIPEHWYDVSQLGEQYIGEDDDPPFVDGDEQIMVNLQAQNQWNEQQNTQDFQAMQFNAYSQPGPP